MKMKVMFGLVWCCGVSCLVPKVMSDDVVTDVHPVAAAQQALFEEAMLAYRLGTVDVEGRVVSEGGDGLSGVSMALSITSREGVGQETMLVDTAFKLSFTNVLDVRAVFSKPGYYEETRMFNVRRTEEPAAEVVLVERAEAVSLQEYRGFLSYTPTGLSEVVDIALGRHAIRKISSAEVREAAGSVPKDGFYLTAETDEDWTFTKEPWRGTSVPTGVRITCFRDGDGFIPFECSEPNPARGYRRMRVAPATGYKSSIVIPPGVENFYFFCKMNGRYGKGYIQPVVRVRGKGNIRTPVRLLLQDPSCSGLNIAGER